MKKLFVILTLLFAVNLSSQISDVTRFPHQNKEQQYFESSPIVINEDEIIIFFINTVGPDTLFYSKTTDAGITWSNPLVVTELGWRASSSPRFLSSLKTSTGRIILAWTDYTQGRIVTIHSDDNALSWSDRISFGTIGLYNLVISELDDGRIWLSHTNFSGIAVFIRESLDDGETWVQSQITFPAGQNRIKSVSFVSISDKILAFFEYNDLGIYYRENASGYFGSVSYPVIDSPFREHNPRVIKYSDTHLKIVYQAVDTSEPHNPKNDIYYIESFNGGLNWGSPQRFTSYAGEDHYVQAAKSGDKTFITFSSTRYTNQPQIAFAKLGETVEIFRPPYIRELFAVTDSLNNKFWSINARVYDDEGVTSVRITLEDGATLELFDDGKHNDGDPLDNHFANSLMLEWLPPSNNNAITVNKLKLPFDNKGTLAGILVKYSQNSVTRAIDISGNESVLTKKLVADQNIKATFEEGVYLFSGGFIISGYANGVLWANAMAHSELVQDYLPGKVGSDGNDPLNNIYTVYRDDPPFGYSWKNWKDAVALGAEFYDGDGDGLYDPVDKNWNGTWEPDEDMPLILGDVTSWCVYNDAVPRAQRRWNTVEPQGIEIKQSVSAINNPELDKVIFIRYSIMNTGTVAELMDSVYFGIWADGDLGEFINELVGCDTLLNSGFYYKDRPDAVYGEDPPAFFISLIQGPVVYTNNPSDSAFINNGIHSGERVIAGAKNLNMTSHRVFAITDAYIGISNAAEARKVLLGRDRVGNFPDPCTYPLGQVRGGVNCNEVNPAFWYSGDPVLDIGWICTQRLDQRNMVNTGPFQLKKDITQDIIIAYVMGRGTDHFNSITIARENVQRAIQEYQSNFASMTYSPPPATNPVTNYVLYQNYPNPFNPITTIRYELPQDGVVTIEVFDILGQKVKTVINEFQKADRYEVTFSAKGGSASGGNSAGLASGVYIYQLRVNDFITSKKMVLIK